MRRALAAMDGRVRPGLAALCCRVLPALSRSAERYPPKVDVDLDALADMISALADGGIILSKVVHDKNVLPRQVMLYRDFVRTVFLGV